MIRLGIYSQIKEQIGTRDVAEHYGYKVNRQGMMRCPFHNDKSPSMKVDKNFICFGCQQKGDVIDFASKLFGLSQYDAAQKLIAEMGLSVNQEKRKRAKPGTVHRAKRERSEQELFELAVTRVYKVYCDYFRLMNLWTLEYAPGSPDEEFHPLFEYIKKEKQLPPDRKNWNRTVRKRLMRHFFCMEKAEGLPFIRWIVEMSILISLWE